MRVQHQDSQKNYNNENLKQLIKANNSIKVHINQLFPIVGVLAPAKNLRALMTHVVSARESMSNGFLKQSLSQIDKELNYYVTNCLEIVKFVYDRQAKLLPTNCCHPACLMVTLL